MLLIKDATTEDIPLLQELTMQAWPQTYTAILGNAQVAYMLDLFYAPEKLKQQMDEWGHRFIICYHEGQPAGFASWSETGPGTYKLHKLYIIPDKQGKGIGSYMIAYIRRELRARGASYLRLNVNRYNAHAIAFYEQIGFSYIQDEDIDIGNGYFMNDHVLELAV